MKKMLPSWAGKVYGQRFGAISLSKMAGRSPATTLSGKNVVHAAAFPIRCMGFSAYRRLNPYHLRNNHIHKPALLVSPEGLMKSRISHLCGSGQ